MRVNHRGADISISDKEVAFTVRADNKGGKRMFVLASIPVII
jgi:hypothetical protein